jgi:NAD(P)-dependent dehydrogenase (short-subunit alcohol dehydrogenase family)
MKPSPKTAVVLGGTGSMGTAAVEALAGSGFRVFFTGRNSKKGNALSARTGSRFIQLDVTDRRATDDCITLLTKETQNVDVFATFVGLVLVSPLGQTSEEQFREVLEVNLTSVFRWSREMFNLMKSKSGGKIVHIVSDAALRGIHHIPVYSIAKSGLLTMSELLAAEGAPYKIRVNAICPGATVPGVQATLAGRKQDAENHLNWATAPSGRHGFPTDIANALLWLISDDAAHVSGATLKVDGASSAAMKAGTRA